MFVPFFKQNQVNSSYINSIKEALDVISSGKESMVLGSFSKQFEKKFRTYLGSAHFVYNSNGLDALIMALKALDISPGDEVVVPCHTYIATWIAPLIIGCKLICAPVREDNFLLDASLLSKYCTPQTKCIMPVHLYGNSCDMKTIMSFANANKINVVEDAAQAHGASINDKKIGHTAISHALVFIQQKI